MRLLCGPRETCITDVRFQGQVLSRQLVARRRKEGRIAHTEMLGYFVTKSKWFHPLLPSSLLYLQPVFISPCHEVHMSVWVNKTRETSEDISDDH